jgi:DNA-binding transcriptional regulator PaaX
MGLTRSARVQLKIMRDLPKAWREIDRDHLVRGVKSLYRSKLVKRKIHDDGTVTLVLTDNGKKRALRYSLATLRIKVPKVWDGKWYLVMYDVPEGLRDLRIELLGKLKSMGFVELQHSVFVCPYECTNEIEFLIEAYDARKYIRRMTVTEIDSPEPLLKHFKLKSVR